MTTVGRGEFLARWGSARISPMKRFLERAIRMGRSATRNVSKLRMRARLCSVVLPKPMPGSKQMREGEMPACSARASLSSKKVRTSATTSV